MQEYRASVLPTLSPTPPAAFFRRDESRGVRVEFPGHNFVGYLPLPWWRGLALRCYLYTEVGGEGGMGAGYAEGGFFVSCASSAIGMEEVGAGCFRVV